MDNPDSMRSALLLRAGQIHLNQIQKDSLWCNGPTSAQENPSAKRPRA